MTTIPTKRQVMQFILDNGGQPHYSGKLKTMFISSYSTKVELKAIEQYGYSLPFKLKTINMPSKVYVDIQ